ncbi:MAG: hypothetical protein ACH346_07620 [Chthoniobacterales bacterium]
MNSGSRLVFIILVLGTLGSGLTFWNYSQHVFSSNRATFIDQAGTIEAIFPRRVAKKIEPHQQARISMGKNLFSAEVVSTTSTNQEVIVRLSPIDKNSFSKIEIPFDDSCSVTIDTTIPF